MTERILLLVDDDEVFSKTLVRSLERRGLTCVHASSSGQLAQLTSGALFSDIILDLNLGESTGLDLIPGLRKRYPNANILVLTGYASIATTVKAIKLGADNYLAKPADTEAILLALDSDAEDTVDGVALGGVQPMSVGRLEWEHIQRVLQENQGNVSATARALNMHRRTLQRKLAKRPLAR